MANELFMAQTALAGVPEDLLLVDGSTMENVEEEKEEEEK